MAMSEDTDTARVIQADREAAAEQYERSPYEISRCQGEQARKGYLDSSPLVQAFARHRTAQAAPAGDGREALTTARDYVADAAKGALTYEGSGDSFIAMAKEDLGRIDAALAQPERDAEVDGWHNAPELPPERVPLLAEYYAWNNTANGISHHVVWWFAGGFRNYPQTTGDAYVKRWTTNLSIPIARTALDTSAATEVARHD